MFEPFHSRRVKGYRRFEYLQYLSPDVDEPELRAFADAVLRGRIRNPWWIEKAAMRLQPQMRMINVPILFHEDMVRHAEQALRAVFEAMRITFDPAVLAAVERHSSTVTQGSQFRSGEDPTRAWSRRLQPEQIQRVLEVVERFGLRSLYDGTDPALDVDDLRLAEF